MKLRHKKMARCFYRVRWERGVWFKRNECTWAARDSAYKWWRSFRGMK